MAKYYLDFEAPLKILDDKITSLKNTSVKTGVDVTSQLQLMERKLAETKEELYSNLNRWERVQLARHPERPITLDYIQKMTEYWFEIHGDRRFAEDKAIVAGLSRLGGNSVMIIGQQKGRGTKDRLNRNFGMPRPEGYRKALRVMELAEKFNIPIITIIDTPGAYPGIGAEERGQAEAIARNIYRMSTLKVPVVCVVTGEGASGGALGIGVGDRLLCLENTWYSVISPEGCASILFHDASRAKEAADAMRVTAQDLMEMEMADEIIPEPLGGAHNDLESTCDLVKKCILKHLDELSKFSPEKLIESRIERFDKMGRWEEEKIE